MDIRDLVKNLKKESWYKKPLNQVWTCPALLKWAKTTLVTELGGKCELAVTELRQWERVKDAYQSIIVTFVTKQMSSVQLKQQLRTAIGDIGDDVEVGAGQVFWSQVDPTGTSDNSDEAQAAYDKLKGEDQRLCDFLQEFTRDLMLFLSTEILAQSCITGL